MKKFFVGLLLVLAVLACFGCSGAVEPERFETKTVTLFDLTSIYPLYKGGDYPHNWSYKNVNKQYTLSESVSYSNGNSVPSNIKIKSGDSLVCKLTLTAKRGEVTDANYTFDGVAENAFEHEFATVTNPKGVGDTLIVTVTYRVEE